MSLTKNRITLLSSLIIVLKITDFNTLKLREYEFSLSSTSELHSDYINIYINYIISYKWKPLNWLKKKTM